MKMRTPVLMNEVPNPGIKLRHNKCRELYEAIGALKRGTALPVDFDSKREADTARAMLRTLAKRDGEFMSSSQDADVLTVYFWLEPKGSSSDWGRAA